MDKSFAGKTVAIIGMARTGMAAAEVLKELGAKVIMFDQQPADKLAEAISEAKRLGAEARAGHPGVDFDGIDLLIPSPGVRATSPVFAEAKSRGVEIMSEIELAYRISKAPMVAITGTNGKTTTTVLTGRIMEADGRESYIGGNVAAGDIKLPLVKAAYLASQDAVIVAEISTFQLEWVTSFKPKVAMLLNITADHSDRHSPKEYAALKESIFRYQDSDDYSISNLDNILSAAAGSRAGGKKLNFSRLQKVEQGAFVEDGLIKVKIGGKETIACSLADIEASGNLPGTHSIENVLAASCAAVAMGARPESIATAVREFEGVEHRMELVAKSGGVEYINNSMCTNPEAFARSVSSVGRPAVVIAGGKHKGGSLEQVAQTIKDYAKYLVLIGVSADEIEEAVREAGYENITRAASMEEAVAKARAVAEPGDTVILSPGCASFDMFSSFEDRGAKYKSAVRQQIAFRGGEDEKSC